MNEAPSTMVVPSAQLSGTVSKQLAGGGQRIVRQWTLATGKVRSGQATSHKWRRRAQPMATRHAPCRRRKIRNPVPSNRSQEVRGCGLGYPWTPRTWPGTNKQPASGRLPFTSRFLHPIAVLRRESVRAPSAPLSPSQLHTHRWMTPDDTLTAACRRQQSWR